MPVYGGPKITRTSGGNFSGIFPIKKGVDQQAILTIEKVRT